MGISRSATITISYLMSRAVILSESEASTLTLIQHNIESLDNEIESKVNEYDGNESTLPFKVHVFEQRRNNTDWTKRVRRNHTKTTVQPVSSIKEHAESQNDGHSEHSENERILRDHNDEERITKEMESSSVCNGLSLGEAYLFVLDRRSIICPNLGFCRQLETWEKYVWDTEDTTLYHIPFFRPDLYNWSAALRGDGRSCLCSNSCCVVLWLSAPSLWIIPGIMQRFLIPKQKSQKSVKFHVRCKFSHFYYQLL